MSEITLDTIAERIDNLKEQNRREHDEISLHLKTQNGSISHLKSWKNYTAGGLAVVTLVFVPVIIALLIHFLTKQYV